MERKSIKSLVDVPAYVREPRHDNPDERTAYLNGMVYLCNRQTHEIIAVIRLDGIFDENHNFFVEA